MERNADTGSLPQPKRQLVEAIRMLERAEIIDHNGHCSVRRDAGSFFINSGASVRGALTEDDIVAVDLDGRARRRFGGAAARVPHPFGDLPAARCGERRRPHAPTVVDLPDHGRRAVPPGLCARRPARRHAGARQPDVGQHPPRRRAAGGGPRRASRGAAQGARGRRGRRRHGRVLRACRLRRGERLPAVHGDADRQAL